MAIRIKQKKQNMVDVRFSDWVKNLQKGEERRLVLLAFFIPGRYPSFTMSLTDGKYRIRKSFSTSNVEILEELRKWYKTIKEAKGRVIFVVKKTDEEIILDMEGVEEGDYIYAPDSNGSLILRQLKNYLDENIPF